MGEVPFFLLMVALKAFPLSTILVSLQGVEHDAMVGVSSLHLGPVELLDELCSEPGSRWLLFTDVLVVPFDESGIERRGLFLARRLDDAAFLNEVGKQVLVSPVSLRGFGNLPGRFQAFLLPEQTPADQPGKDARGLLQDLSVEIENRPAFMGFPGIAVDEADGEGH